MNLQGSLRLLGERGMQTTRRAVPITVVLAYHRVANPASDPQLLCVTPENFADHLRVMSQLGVCIPLRHLVQKRAVGRVPKRGIVVTFDDGYADNLENAEPILRKAGVPATVFVSTGGLEAGLPFWWDELAMLLLMSPHLPPEVSITTNSKRMRWDTRCAAPAETDAGRWDVTQQADPTPRQAIYRAAHSLCREMEDRERESILDQLRQQIDSPSPSTQSRRLTPEQVAELARSEVVEVGAHGVTHSSFSASTPENNRRELRESRAQLMEMTGKGIDLFSYPFGSRGDLRDDAAGQVRSCGFMAACANWPGRVWWGTNPYRIPRYLVRDWTAEDFAWRLEDWLNSLAKL